MLTQKLPAQASREHLPFHSNPALHIATCVCLCSSHIVVRFVSGVEGGRRSVALAAVMLGTLHFCNRSFLGPSLWWGGMNQHPSDLRSLTVDIFSAVTSHFVIDSVKKKKKKRREHSTSHSWALNTVVCLNASFHTSLPSLKITRSHSVQR